MAFIQRSSDFGKAYVHIKGLLVQRPEGAGFFVKPDSGGRKPVFKTNNINGQQEHCMAGVYFLYHPLPTDPIPGSNCNRIVICNT
jgi:hypothetical protein